MIDFRGMRLRTNDTLSIAFFSFFTVCKAHSDFNQFLMDSNKNFKEHLFLFDYHILKIGEEDFKNKYLSELAKETFEFKVYQRKKNIMLDETAYDNQLINFNNSLNKLRAPVQFVMKLIQKMWKKFYPTSSLNPLRATPL